MSTNTQFGGRIQEVPFTNTEAHGIICAAMFHDYNTIFNGADNDILVAVINGDMQLALRLAVIKLANYKQRAEGHDRPDIHMTENILDELFNGNVNPYHMDDTFGKPTEETDVWDGDENDRMVMH
jgi:hypothetical protein